MDSSANVTASSSNISSAGQGITGGYDGSSETLKIFIAFFLGLAMYNVVELLILILGTFTKYRGLYFWSLTISSIGIIPYSLGFLFKYFNILQGGAKWFPVILLTIGWYPMVTGQAVVLWSRLHLVVEGERGDQILRWTKWMIIINVIILHFPTTILTFGSNNEHMKKSILNNFTKGYDIMEKIQMCGFFLQEVALSSIYIMETIKILRSSIQAHTRRLMYQLLAINVLIIIMDLGLLGLECASLYILETITKGVFYSIKLKLEFAVLGKLVQFVGKPQDSDNHTRRSNSIAYIETEKSDGHAQAIASGMNRNPYDISDFVDVSRVKSDTTHASIAVPRSGSTLRPGVTESDLDLARLEHWDTGTSERKPNGDLEWKG